MGGGYALMLATTGGYQASSVNYGMIDEPEAVLADACPIVASYEAKDRSLRSAPTVLERVLTDYGVDHDEPVEWRGPPLGEIFGDAGCFADDVDSGESIKCLGVDTDGRTRGFPVTESSAGVFTW